MAQEYGALLKWPKELEAELATLMGKPSALLLQLKVSGEEVPQIHAVVLAGGWDESILYERCFEHIRPIKNKMLKGHILCLVPLASQT